MLREIVTTTLAADTGAHWIETSVTPAMAWFEPQWVKGTDCPVAFHRHQLSRASVIVPLDGAWLTTRSGLKRNVKESLGRSKNRIAKDGRPWAVHSHTDTIDDEVVCRFLDLHRSRAAQDQSTSHHPDAFSDPARRAMMRTVLPALGRQGRARILELELGGRIVAAQLVLHAPGLTYIHSSGFTADVWDLGPVTFLQSEAISAAADRGERWINMSPGPNVAKLRWSEASTSTTTSRSGPEAADSGGGTQPSPSPRPGARSATPSRWVAIEGDRVTQVSPVLESSSGTSRRLV